ncbi:MAG: putative Ig domain-containing protein [Candidatus Thiodiazotropha sp. (ex Monitilora ramsayi)]|nr:putative Ig domain-containing protein [Candidatus Thiodiazotropha sp. (ex Monitilora ramsayi)]
MKSLGKLTSVLVTTLILTACGSEETTDSNPAGNVVSDPEVPEVPVANRSPEINGIPATVTSVGATYAFTPNASDPDGDELSYTAANLPGWVSLDASSGTLSGIPTSGDVGSSSDITLTVSDGSATASLPVFNITVIDSGEIQVVSARISDGMDDVEEWDTGIMYLNSSDLELINDDGDQLVGLRFSLPVPKDAIITQANLRFTTDEVSTGDSNLVIWAEASDDASSFSANSGDVSRRASTVATANWTTDPWNVVGESTSAQTSSDFSSVVQEVVNRSGWNSDNHLVLVISGSGTRTADAYEGNAANAAVLTVHYTGGDNQAPTISGVPDSGATEGYAYSFSPLASDPDGDNLSFSIANKPAWASFDTTSGVLEGTPASGDAGSYNNITITVSDGDLNASLGAFNIIVSDSNRAPVISGSPVTSTVELSTYSFTPTASDADGDSLTYSVSNQPSWANFNTSTGNLSGTPGYLDAGTYSNIVISVSDGSVSASLSPFSIAVADLNRAPTISGTPASSLAEGNAYSFTPAASDPDSNSLTFSVANLPQWASFNDSTGTLSGTPDFTAAGTYSNIVISVSDGAASASLASFNITVTDVNQAPTISGAPNGTVTAGDGYTFVPTADDVDGDSLTFSVSNLPAWASFNSSNGSLSGTPQESDVGEYNNILINVSDGNEDVSLGAFSIVVNSSVAAKGSMILSWSAPSTRIDGSPLNISEIDGYCVFIGDSIDSLQMEVDLNDGTATSVTIPDKEVGTYYVALTTYDVDGNASSYSNVVEVDVTN